ncbi:MAG: ParB/RepB/Spo0J family partition protein [Anaerolineales bacterium]|nr:ParB/RepB/Spo0J family partition protein [Anaerolineales bacterium]
MAERYLQEPDRLLRKTEGARTASADREGARQQLVPIQRIVPNRFNPRQVVTHETLDELIQSMKMYGFIGALDGRELDNGKVELAYGSRRLLAAEAASIAAIPVFLHEWDDSQMRFVALVENLAREDLTPVDEALTVGELHERLGLSTREISQRIGKPRSWVQDRLALYSAPDDVKQMVQLRPDSVRAARFVARIEDPASRRVLQEHILSQDITTRQVQQAVQRVGEGVSAADAVSQATRPPLPRPYPAPASQRKDREREGADGDEPSADREKASAALVYAQEVPFPVTLSTLQRPTRSVRPGATGAQSSATGLAGAAHGWPSSGVPLIVLASEALDGFDPGSLSDDERADALDWLKQLISTASRLVDLLERRR